ncbi:MAG TPA: hypothetical protein VIM11_02360 [Tepidisphaeraceae bacterium]
MRRKLFTAASALSLLLSVETVVLWVRSYHEMYQWEWTTTKGLEDPAWRRGELSVGMGRLGYVAWAPDGVPNKRYFKSARRFRVTDHGNFVQYHFQFDPWGSGTMKKPPPITEKNYWWKGVQYSWTYWGFGRDHITQRQVWLPLWLLSVLFFVLPSLLIIGWLSRYRRRRRQQCLSCAYNLTGNTSGTCPECGTAVAGKVKITA